LPDIIERMDEALQTIEGLSSSYSDYAGIIRDFEKAGGGAQGMAAC
jgi:hypothetical protein